MPSFGYASRATLDDIQTFEKPRHHLSRLPSMARGRAFTAYTLVFLGPHGTRKESPCQGQRMAPTVPWADCGAYYSSIARFTHLPVREQSPRRSHNGTNLLAALRQLDWTVLKESYLEGVNAESFFYALNDGTGFVHQHLETLSITYASLFEVTLGDGPRQYDELPWDNLRALRIVNARCNWKRLSASMCHLTSFEYKIESHFVNFPQFHLFLLANLRLEKLVLNTNLSYQTDAPDSLTLAHLRHLELSGVVPFRVKSGNFSLPSLQILRMTKLRNAASTLSELVKDEGTSFAELVELTARDCALGSQLVTSVLLRALKLEILNCTGDAVNDAAESLTTRPCVGLQADWAPGASKLIVTNLPILCPALSVLDLSQSASLKTGPVMRIVKERIALAASEDGGRYQLPGQDGDRVVSRIRVLKVDECPHIEAEILPWFRNNVQHFSCRYELRRKR
jgi:hypothetical protein